MKIYKLVILFFLLPMPIIAQKVLSKTQILEDYSIFKEVLTSGHPSMYDYTSEAEWDSIFNVFELNDINGVKTSNDLFKSISSLANNVKDGHLRIHHPRIDTLPKMFPLLLKIIGGKLYTDTDDFGIPVGSELISINNRNSKSILKEFLKYASSDGFNITRKYLQIEKEFGILHYYEYGSQVSYTVEYKSIQGETFTKEITPKSFESIGNRYPNRNSHFALYHQDENRLEHFKNRIVEKWPFVYYTDSINTAVLTVNSFGLDPKEFKSKLVELFKDIKKRKAKNLIIDIRQNNGGYRINAINLYSFLTKKPFKQRISECAVTKMLPQENFVIHTSSDYTDFFDMYFGSSTKNEKRWFLSVDHAQSEMVPFKNPFNGNVYVLISGNTFSAASAFALNAKNDINITLVGEETGGGYYFHTGQYFATYELPHSKVIMRMPFVKINKYVIDNTIKKGTGILPDMEISLTIQDLIQGVDSQLNYIVKSALKTR